MVNRRALARRFADVTNLVGKWQAALIGKVGEIAGRTAARIVDAHSRVIERFTLRVHAALAAEGSAHRIASRRVRHVALFTAAFIGSGVAMRSRIDVDALQFAQARLAEIRARFLANAARDADESRHAAASHSCNSRDACAALIGALHVDRAAPVEQPGPNALAVRRRPNESRLAVTRAIDALRETDFVALIWMLARIADVLGRPQAPLAHDANIVEHTQAPIVVGERTQSALCIGRALFAAHARMEEFRHALARARAIMLKRRCTSADIASVAQRRARFTFVGSVAATKKRHEAPVVTPVASLVANAAGHVARSQRATYRTDDHALRVVFARLTESSLYETHVAATRLHEIIRAPVYRFACYDHIKRVFAKKP